MESVAALHLGHFAVHLVVVATTSPYTVQPGDTLSGIAVSQAPLYIGTGFEPIFEANRHIIGDDPDLIHPGTVLRLPSNL